MLPPAARCTICSDGEHRSNQCPMLAEPLKEGFYKPSGGYQGGGDDEDEKALFKRFILETICHKQYIYLMSFRCQNKISL